MKTWLRYLTLMSLFPIVFGCAGSPKNQALAGQCEQGLNSAYEKLDLAKSKGFGGSVNWTKAASLLSAAKIQQEFGKYPNCIDKVKRANYYIKESQNQ